MEAASPVIAEPPQSKDVRINRSGLVSKSPIHQALAQAKQDLKPVNVSCELTYRCNIDCIHCYCIRGGGRRELTGKEWKDFLTHTAEEGGFYLTFTGGEILVRQDFFEIYHHARNLGFAIKLKTNATLITPDIADRIAERNPLSVDVSVLGGGDQVHDRVTRVRGSHEKAWRGIELLRERGVQVDVRTSIMDTNYEGYQQIKSQAKGLGCSTTCDPHVHARNDGDHSVQHQRLQDEAFKKFLNSLTLETPIGRKQPKDESMQLMCGAGRGNFSVNPYGDITTCNPMQLPLGNVLQDTWADVRRSKLLQKIVSLRVTDLPECRACDYKEYCDRCHATALADSGSLVGKSVQACKMAKLVKAMAEDHHKEHLGVHS